MGHSECQSNIFKSVYSLSWYAFSVFTLRPYYVKHKATTTVDHDVLNNASSLKLIPGSKMVIKTVPEAIVDLGHETGLDTGT